LLFLLFAALVVFWLQQPSDGPIEPPNAPPTQLPADLTDDFPDILIRPFNRSFHVDGRKEWEINAAEARGYKEEERFSLKQISDSTFTDQLGRVFHLSAAAGEWEKGRQRFTVSGNVQVEVQAKEGEQPIHFQSDDMTLDRGRNIVTVSSPVKIWRDDLEVTGKSLYGDLLIGSMVIAPDTLTRIMKIPSQARPGSTHKQLEAPLTITADELTIDQQQQQLTYTGGPPTAVYGGITLTAEKMTYQQTTGTSYILASGDVQTQLLPSALDELPSASAGTEPILVRAENLVYDLKTNSAILDDNVTISQGANTFAGDQLEIFLNETNDAATGAILRGNLRVVYGMWEGQADQAIYNPDRDSLTLTGDPRLGRGDAWIAADQIHRVITTGETRFAGNVRGGITGNPPNTAEPTPLAAEKLPFLDNLGGGAPVRFSADSAVYVPELDSATLTDNVTILRGEESISTEAATAFFRGTPPELAYIDLPGSFQMTRGEDVLTGQRGRYFASADRFTVTGDARLWRKDDFIRADTMEVFPGQNAGTAAGNVQAFLAGQEPADTSANRPTASAFVGSVDEPLLVHSDVVEFDNHMQTIHFTGHAQAEQGAWRLKADKLSATIVDQDRTARTMSAEGGVELTDGQMTGTGQTMEYTGGDRSVVLIGSKTAPAKITWGTRGTQGERIVIYLDQRRYVVMSGESMYIPEGAGIPAEGGKLPAWPPRKSSGE